MNVLKELGVGHAVDSPDFFVGRRKQLGRLRDRLSGGRYEPVWIYGPARIGKSALAWMAGREAVSEARVLDVDVMKCRSLDQALTRAIAVACKGGIAVDGVGREGFRNMVSTFASGLIIVFDEFNGVAVHLQTEEQAYLRQLVTEHECFGMVFVTSLPPADVMEEVSDIASRLSGVCQMTRLGPLERRDVIDLCNRVALAVERPELARMADGVLSRVGGFPFATRVFVEEVVRCVIDGETLDDELLDDALEEVRPALMPHIQRWVRGFSLESRLAAAGRVQPDSVREALRRDGLWVRRDGGFSASRIVQEAASELLQRPVCAAVGGEDDSAVLRVLRAVADINEALKLRGQNEGFAVGYEYLRAWPLQRVPVTKQVFRESLDYLYKTFFELARARKATKNTNDKRYLLPEPYAQRYKDARVVGAISDLRNYLSHDSSRRPRKHFRLAAERFLFYCGKPFPSSDDDRGRIRDGLVRELEELLLKILHEICEADDLLQPE